MTCWSILVCMSLKLYLEWVLQGNDGKPEVLWAQHKQHRSLAMNMANSFMQSAATGADASSMC